MSLPNVFCLVDDPDFVRRTLEGFLQARRHALDIRREQSATATIAERMAMASVLEQIDRWVFDARAWLSARGLACNASTVGASMAQGCAAVFPAVGPASEKSPEVAVTTPDDPLSLCPEGQFLPVAGVDRR